jgi:hypothetical protein
MHLVGDLFECMMMHGLTNPKFMFVCLLLAICRIFSGQIVGNFNYPLK